MTKRPFHQNSLPFSPVGALQRCSYSLFGTPALSPKRRQARVGKESILGPLTSNLSLTVSILGSPLFSVVAPGILH